MYLQRFHVSLFHVRMWGGWVDVGGCKGELNRFLITRSGEINEDTSEEKNSDFTKKDFLLVLQSKNQEEMMNDYPRTLCADGTHKLNQYGHILLSLLVINDNGQGLVVAWAITSRENGTIWMIMCRNLRPKCLQCKPEVFMSDDTNSAWNGLIQVWSSLTHKLLCHFHLLQNVVSHCCGTQCKLPGTKKQAGST